ncbi:hypothetical protein ACT8ZV_11660 [Nocardioides sp. MAHUQ-72]|uniref:hypothetical protein n=1 Tax=unclassified Nocardioides TaxID=2615069 RepID=UPI0036154F88
MAWRAWAAGWGGALAAAFLNATLRAGYGTLVGDLTADQIACVVLLVLILPWTVRVERRHPLESTRDAVTVGAAWAGATVCFEFTFGHWVNHDSWSELVEAYDVMSGRWWTLDVVGIALAPAAARAWNRRARRQS